MDRRFAQLLAVAFFSVIAVFRKSLAREVAIGQTDGVKGNEEEGRDGEVRKKSFEIGHFQVFTYPEKLALAPSRTAEAIRDGGFMLHFHRTILLGLLTAASGALTVAAQTFDNSGNSLLNGAYFVREVMFTQIGENGAIGKAQSAIGTVTFDGNGNYSFSGQVMVSTAGSTASTTSVTGTYKVSANHLLELTSLFTYVYGTGATPATITEYGGVAAVGPGAFVASATEGEYYDIFVGIPVPANVTNASLAGGYTAAYLGFPGADVNSVRQCGFTLDSDGKGNFAATSVTGSAANLGNTPLTQAVSGLTYALGANGSGSIDFGAASLNQLVSGTQSFAVSADGNLLIGGSPDDFDLFIALRSLTAPASNSTYQGVYFVAGMWDEPPAYVAAWYGSATATLQGLSPTHWRLNQIDGGSARTEDYTFSGSYTVPASGVFADSDGNQYTLGANGQAAFLLGGYGFYELALELQAPTWSGTGVFLQPLGIVNAANFAPITNPIAPVEMISLFGSGMSSETAQAPAFPLPINLAGTEVLINGTAAPLVYVSPTYITAVVPAAIHPDTGEPDDAPWATFQVVNNGVRSNSAMVRAGFGAPGIFTTLENGTGEAAARHADYSLVNASHPAVAGETVLIYLTGLGLVTPAIPDGAAAPDKPLSSTESGVYVYIDNQSATVSFAGLAPGFAGLYQVNAVVPQTPDSGDVSLNIWVESTCFNSQATISIAAE